MKRKFYIKTHNITKLKYFGYHDGPENDIMELHKYRGSGIYWKNHIKKYGYIATTQLVGEFENDDLENIISFAKKFSTENDIVNSKIWANAIEEDGIGGWHKGCTFSKETIQKKKDNWKNKTQDEKDIIGKKISLSLLSIPNEERQILNDNISKGHEKRTLQQKAESTEMRLLTNTNKTEEVKEQVRYNRSKGQTQRSDVEKEITLKKWRVSMGNRTEDEILLSSNKISNAQKGISKPEGHGNNVSSGKRKKGKWYKLFHITDGLIRERISHAELQSMTGNLPKTLKNKYIGLRKAEATKLKNADKSHLIGLYVEEITQMEVI